jgi:hypothetical protein
MANLDFSLPSLRNRNRQSRLMRLLFEHCSRSHRLTSNDTLKVRTTSALFDLKTVTDVMGCSLASRVIIDAAMIRG